MKRSRGTTDLTALDDAQPKDCESEEFFFHPLKCVKYNYEENDTDDSFSQCTDFTPYDEEEDDSLYLSSLTIRMNPIELVLKVPNDNRRIVYARSPKKDYLKKDDNYLISGGFKDKYDEKSDEIVCYLEKLRLQCHKRSE